MIPIMILFGLASLACIAFVIYYPFYAYATENVKAHSTIYDLNGEKVVVPAKKGIFEIISDIIAIAFYRWLVGCIITGK